MKLSERLRKGLAIKEKIGRPYCAAVIVAAGHILAHGRYE